MVVIIHLIYHDKRVTIMHNSRVATVDDYNNKLITASTNA